jgi:acetolactate synthase-1/2/3 large subunit
MLMSALATARSRSSIELDLRHPEAHPELVESLASLLRGASAPLLIAGYGAVLAGAGGALLRLANALPRLRFCATARAKGAFPERHPAYLGVLGFAGHDSVRRALFDEADWVIVIGSRLGEMTSDNWDPRWHTLNLIRIDIDVHAPRTQHGSYLYVQGDARRILEQLADSLGSHERGSIELPTAASAPLDAVGILNPKSTMLTLNETLSDQCHVFCGIGNTMAWAIHYFTRNLPNRWHLNLSSGAMGHALPAAIGASLLGSPTLVMLGDAEFLMTGFELHTAVEGELQVIVVVLNDQGHGMVRIGSSVHCPDGGLDSEFHRPVRLVDAAVAMGASAVSVRAVSELKQELHKALQRKGPTLIEIPITKTCIPPLGARLSALSQAFGMSITGGVDHARSQRVSASRDPDLG